MDTAAQVIAALNLANAIIQAAGGVISASMTVWSAADLAAVQKVFASSGETLDAARAQIDADAV